VPSLLTEPSSVGNVHHRLLSILLKVSAPFNVDILKMASLRNCFAIVDKEGQWMDPWRWVILRKVPKTVCEVLDEFGESVFDTVTNTGETGIVDQWGVWY